MPDLVGRTAVVTGSTTGIGLAYACALASAGANVVITGVGAVNEIELTCALIEKEFGVKCASLPVTIMKPSDSVEMIVFAELSFGSVEILVSNAGIQLFSQANNIAIDRSESIASAKLSSAFHIAHAAFRSETSVRGAA